MVMMEQTLPDQDKRVKKLKRTLEGWREVVLPLHAVLMWDKSWYPGLIFGVISTFYFLLWLLDPSILTIIAIVGILITMIDYFAPMIISNLYPVSSWNKNKERLFEEICKSIVISFYWICYTCESFYKMRETSSRLFYCILISFLSVMAWIGATTNNLFITYMTTLCVGFFPGLLSHKKVGVYLSQVINIMCSFLKSKQKNN